LRRPHRHQDITGAALEITLKVAAAMEEVVRSRNVPALVVVAPPKTLADLRHAFHADVKARVIAEINKDLTKH
jgi:protein required for attachment to host cells